MSVGPIPVTGVYTMVSSQTPALKGEGLVADRDLTDAAIRQGP